MDMFLEYFTMKTDADPLFGKFLFAQLIGHLLGKKSFVNITPGVERLNLYVALIGDSFKGRKSVSQDIISNFYDMNVLLPNESSAEKYVANLADTPDGVWMYGEFSKILKHIRKGGYLSTVSEVLNDLYSYERPVYRREIMNAEFIIENPYPTFSTTLTPDVLKKETDIEMVNGGLFGRLLLVPGITNVRPRGALPPDVFLYDMNIKRFVNSISNNKIVNDGIEFRFDDEALDMLNVIEKKLGEHQYSAIAGRYGQAIIKISAILQFLKNIDIDNSSKNCIKSNSSNNSSLDAITSIDEFDDEMFTFFTNIPKVTIITKNTILEAYEMVKPCLGLSEELFMYVSLNKKNVAKVKEYVEKNHPVLRSEVMRFCNLTKRECEEAEQTLNAGGWDWLWIMNVQMVEKKKASVVYCKMEGTDCSKCEYKDVCTRPKGE